METTALHTMQALAGTSAVQRLPALEVLYRAGDAGDSLFCVLAGAIRLDWPDGGQEEFLPGQLFGVAALVDSDHRRHGTATAIVASEVIEMNREEFLFALQETPLFCLQLLASLEDRLRRSRG